VCLRRLSSRAQGEELSTRRDVWRAALLGTLTGAAIVIAWIEVVHRASL
jgi:hypothetical protein